MHAPEPNRSKRAGPNNTLLMGLRGEFWHTMDREDVGPCNFYSTCKDFCAVGAIYKLQYY